MSKRLDQESGRAVLRGEMGTSPDDALNENLNTGRDVFAPPISDWLDSPVPASKPAFHQTDAVIEMLPDLDDETLEELSGAVAFEEAGRTPSRRGAEAFWASYRPARRDHNGDLRAAEENLNYVEGAICAFFKKRGAAVHVGASKVDARSSVSIEATIRVRDPRIGRLRVELYVGATDYATIMVRRPWGGDTLLGADASRGGVKEAVEKFAAWAAKQP